MGSDALAIAAAVAFLVAVVAVVFLPFLILKRRDRKRGIKRRSGSGDSNITSSMNDIINLS